MAKKPADTNSNPSGRGSGKLALSCVAVVAAVLLLAAALSAVCSLNAGQPLPFAGYFS